MPDGDAKPQLRDAIWTRRDGLLFLPREADDTPDGRPERQYLCRIVVRDGTPIILWLDRYRTGRRAARGDRPIPYEVEQSLSAFLKMVSDLCDGLDVIGLLEAGRASVKKT